MILKKTRRCLNKFFAGSLCVVLADDGAAFVAANEIDYAGIFFLVILINKIIKNVLNFCESFVFASWAVRLYVHWFITLRVCEMVRPLRARLVTWIIARFGGFL